MVLTVSVSLQNRIHQGHSNIILICYYPYVHYKVYARLMFKNDTGIKYIFTCIHNSLWLPHVQLQIRCITCTRPADNIQVFILNIKTDRILLPTCKREREIRNPQIPFSDTPITSWYLIILFNATSHRLGSNTKSVAGQDQAWHPIPPSHESTCIIQNRWNYHISFWKAQISMIIVYMYTIMTILVYPG